MRRHFRRPSARKPSFSIVYILGPKLTGKIIIWFLLLCAVVTIFEKIYIFTATHLMLVGAALFSLLVIVFIGIQIRRMRKRYIVENSKPIKYRFYNTSLFGKNSK